MNTYIKTAVDARKAIGKRVTWLRAGWWDDRKLSGILEKVSGKNLLIGGDWKWRPNLIDLHIDPDQGQGAEVTQ